MSLAQQEKSSCSNPTITITEVGHIRSWWLSLSSSPRERLLLRNALRPEDIVQLSLVKELAEKLPQRQASGKGVAALAGLLANVDCDEPDMRFICRLGTARTQGLRPALSEVHFTKLHLSKDVTEFYRRMRRAVLLLRRSVDIQSLSDCVLHWSEAHLAMSESEQSRSVMDELIKQWQEEYRSNAK